MAPPEFSRARNLVEPEIYAMGVMLLELNITNMNKELNQLMRHFFSFLSEKIQIGQKKTEKQKLLRSYINDLESKYNFKKKIEIYHRFGKGMSKTNALEMMTQIMLSDYLVDLFIDEEKKVLYGNLTKLQVINFESIFQKDNDEFTILDSLKIDVLLTCLKFPENYDIQDVKAFLSIKSCKKEKLFLGKNLLRKVATSPVAIEAFFHALRTQKNKGITKRNIKEKILAIISKNTIYTAELPQGFIGMTIYNSSIHFHK